MKHFYFRWSLWRRIKACWLILSNREFYLEVVVSRYKSGEELACEVLSNITDTETAVNRLIRHLKDYLKMKKDEHKRVF